MALAITPGSSRALEIEYSNPFYYVFNGITQLRIGEFSGSFAVEERQSSTTGSLELSSDIDYAAAFADSDAFSVRTSSRADGADLAARGLATVSSEGLSRFEVDFAVTSGTGSFLLRIDPVLSTSDVSTLPRPGFGQPGTSTGRLHGIGILQGNDELWDGEAQFVRLEVGVTYRLSMLANAVSSVAWSTGFASATTELGVTLSAFAVPEPSLGLLLLPALCGLARRRPRSSAATPEARRATLAARRAGTSPPSASRT